MPASIGKLKSSYKFGKSKGIGSKPKGSRKPKGMKTRKFKKPRGMK